MNNAYPKLNSAPNLAGNRIITGKNVKLIINENSPSVKNIAKFFQFTIAAYAS